MPVYVCFGPEEIFSMCWMNPRGSRSPLIGCLACCVCFHCDRAVAPSRHPGRVVNHAAHYGATNPSAELKLNKLRLKPTPTVLAISSKEQSCRVRKKHIYQHTGWWNLGSVRNIFINLTNSVILEIII